MIQQAMIYSFAVAAACSIVGLCLERLTSLWQLPRRAAWIAAILCSILLPPALMLRAGGEASPLAPLAASQVHVDERIPSSIDTPPLPTSTVQLAPQLARTWHLPQLPDRILLATWALSVALIAAFFLGAHLRLRRRMSGWHHARLHDHPVLVSETTGPALVGTWRPRVVLPRWLLEEPVAMQALVLEHERQHIAARDPLLIRIGAVLVMLVPWNLPLWWQWRRMRYAIELDCDARVLHAGAAPQAYGEALLAVVGRAQRMPVTYMTMSEPVSALERRIRDLLPDPPRHVALQASAALMLLAFGVSVVLAMDAPAIVAGNARSGAAHVSNPVGGNSLMAAAAAQPAAPGSIRTAPATATSAPSPAGELKARDRAAIPMTPVAVEGRRAEGESAAPVVLQLKYASARDTAAFINSAPGIGLLSEGGSIGIDAASNTLLVRDDPAHVAAIRQLIQNLDMPVRQVMVRAAVALVDPEVVQELTAEATREGQWSPVTVIPLAAESLAAESRSFPTLDAAHRAGRAEILALPRMVTLNREMASLVSGGENSKLEFEFTPTIGPNESIKLDVTARMETKVVPSTATSAAGMALPAAIDTTEVKSTALIESGKAVVLDLMERGKPSGAGPPRHLIAIVIATPLAAPAVPSR